MTRFETCHAITAKWEGGWSDHPSDPGGKTMYGITQGTYHAWLRKQKSKIRPVRQITKTQALAIYKQNYWSPIASRLKPGVDLAAYDACVNSGLGRARKWLAASVGGKDHETVKRICARRLAFMRSLRIWKTFGRGWSRRVADIEARGVKMALAKTPGAFEREAVAEKTKARKVKQQQKTAAGGSVIGGGGATQVDWGGGGEFIIPLLVIAGIAVAIVLFIRSRINDEREKAYEKVMNEGKAS